jgi:hypothetical protein
MLEQVAWLMDGIYGPIPVTGRLRLDREGTLSFTMSEEAGRAPMRWLEKALDTKDLKERLAAGERPVVFSLPVAGIKIGWPLALGRSGMRIYAPDRKWLVSLKNPRAGVIDTINWIFTPSRGQEWKRALAAAGAVQRGVKPDRGRPESSDAN